MPQLARSRGVNCQDTDRDRRHRIASRRLRHALGNEDATRSRQVDAFTPSPLLTAPVPLILFSGVSTRWVAGTIARSTTAVCNDADYRTPPCTP